MARWLKLLTAAICLIVAFETTSAIYFGCLKSSCRAYEEIDKRLTAKVGDEWDLTKNYAAINELLNEEVTKGDGLKNQPVVSALEDLLELQRLRNDKKCDEHSTEVLARILSHFNIKHYYVRWIEDKQIKGRLNALVYESYVQAVTSCKDKFIKEIETAAKVLTPAIRDFFATYIRRTFRKITNLMGDSWTASIRYDDVEYYFAKPNWKSYDTIGSALYNAVIYSMPKGHADLSSITVKRNEKGKKTVVEDEVEAKFREYFLTPCKNYVDSYDVTPAMKYMKFAHKTRVPQKPGQLKKFNYLFEPIAEHYMCKSLLATDIKRIRHWILKSLLSDF